MNEKATIIVEHNKKNKLVSLTVYNQADIYHKDFFCSTDKIKFSGNLSLDGNEYDLYILNKKTKEKIFSINLYYSLDSNLVISKVDKDGRVELITIPQILLS